MVIIFISFLNFGYITIISGKKIIYIGESGSAERVNKYQISLIKPIIDSGSGVTL